MNKIDRKDIIYAAYGFALPVVYILIFWFLGSDLTRDYMLKIFDFLADIEKASSRNRGGGFALGLGFLIFFGPSFLTIWLVQKYDKDNRWKAFGYGFFVGMIPFMYAFTMFQLSI